ncbi:hypothetical protein LL06_08615 [Hoeflea sp. BAL378]|uniref:hypothetical protein n=1 Tax=Hoeflea sp. BAL378 TaxID=1547437 RepID=UPI000513FCCA|nr:hypothetical protein [Hoeflea sp. BAL378]KGF69871.1 hypothetical protein LL06_08615 [Hoeflea sp. BAL378]
MRSPSVPKSRYLSVLATSVLVLVALGVASCEAPKNRFDYDDDGTPKKKPKYPKCATLQQPGGNVVVTALEALGSFAFITPASASTAIEEDLPLLPRGDAILMAGDSGGGGELIRNPCL